nr:hypothetical protein [Mucilaginibacter sp. SP1R1]
MVINSVRGPAEKEVIGRELFFIQLHVVYSCFQLIKFFMKKY